MTRDRLKWLKTAFPVHGIGWQLPSFVTAVVVMAAAVWFWLRDPAEDFLTSDAKVWHLVLAVVAETLAAGVITWWARHRFMAREATGRASLAPTEINYLGVKWPVAVAGYSNVPLSTHFKVGGPMCPTCRTPLSMLATDNGETEGYVRLPLEDELADALVAKRMLFVCSNDGARYDLREHGCSMYVVKQFVNDQAMGQYRTAQAAARAQNARKVT